mgnify:CR=1 FL=1
MKNVLIISDRLEHYRIPLFNLLCDSVNLTVAYSNDIENGIIQFSEHKIKVINKGPFIVYKNLPNFELFDIIILPFNLRCVELWKQIFKKRKFKLFIFGIGVVASYGKLYDQKNGLDFLRSFIIRKVDSAIFYERYPYVKYVANGISPSKLSIAYNTVFPNPYFDFATKEYKSFIFVGSLYKQKKIFNLLEAYLLAYKKSNSIIQPLEIIGNGDEFEAIHKWISDNNLESKIMLHGQINDDMTLLPIFNRAIACISPGQAGLSVQKSFSYAVPFITSENPITGGEAFSIINGVNGYFYNSSISALADILLSFSDEEKVIEMSKKAYIFYSNFRSVEIWKRGFLENIIP